MTDARALGWTPADIHGTEIAFALEMLRIDKGINPLSFSDLLHRIADDYVAEAGPYQPAKPDNGLPACLVCVCVLGGLALLAAAGLYGVLVK